MNLRTSVLTVGLGLIACRMDNPAFDDVGDDVDGSDGTTDSSESTSAGTSASTDDVGTSPDATDTAGTTDADCMPGTQCGTCHVCDMAGDCVPDAGASCDEAVLHCGDYLYGAEEGTCYRLVETPLLGTCTEQGECQGLAPNVCPVVKGEVHFACDPVCVTNLQGCQPGALAAVVDLADMCAVDSQTSACKPTCSNENESAIEIYGCLTGECAYLGADFCNPYACNVDTVACFVGCELPSECAQGFVCVDFDCVMP